MEEHRCRMVAIPAEDSRCNSLIGGAQIETEDPRYKSPHRAISEVLRPRLLEYHQTVGSTLTYEL